MAKRVRGVVPVIPISFDENEEIVLGDLRRAVDFAVTCGAGAMCLPAYGSEFYKLSDAERESVVAEVIQHANRRLLVIAQANHVSAKVAAEVARRYEKLGADLISLALPRQFPLSEVDMLRYVGKIADAVSCPILLQDFNPGGPTIGADFLLQATRQHANIHYAKLEEPMVGVKIAAIRARCGDQLDLLTGWGGLYLLDGLASGSCGVMPGLAIADLFANVFKLHDTGNQPAAEDAFAKLLPYINYSLQSFEHFLLLEKTILVCRGILSSSRCRDATRSADPAFMARAEQIIDPLLRQTKSE